MKAHKVIERFRAGIQASLMYQAELEDNDEQIR